MAKIFNTSYASIQRSILILLNILFSCYRTNALHDNYSQSNKFDYVTTNSTSKRCQHIYRSLTQQQLAKYVDASGKPGSGIYGGNTLWYGSYSECHKLTVSRYCLAIFSAKVSVGGKSEMYHMEWGVCMPDVCTKEDVSNNIEFLLYNVSGIYEVKPFTKLLLVKCAEDPEYTTSVVITIIFCGLLVGLCLLATIVEILSESDKPYNKVETVENAGHISMDKDADEKTPLLSPDTTTSKVKQDKGLIYQALHSFSMIRNIKSTMNTNVGKRDLTYLHGIRVLSLFWIILFHISVFTVSNFWPYDNLLDVIQFLTRRLTSVVLTTAYGVDTFFLLSGLLVMYTNMSKKAKNNGQTNWFKYYFRRFWRLTPTLMFCILLRAKLAKFFGAGPVWFVEADSSACSEHWWTNLLYLNNFLKTDGMCLPHTWYLAADMQMFIISPIFLIVAYRYKFRPLVCIVGVTVLASIIITACLAADDHALPLTHVYLRINSFFKDYQNEIFHPESFDEPFEDIYIKPYCRIPPYVMGMVLGYVLYKYFSKEFKLPLDKFPQKFIAVTWISAIALALTVVYAPHSAAKEDPHIWTTGERAVFWSLKWSIWGLCIFWLIFACHYNYAGLVKNILAAKFWIPLSRINYAAYIIHYDVIRVLIFNIETPIHYTGFTVVTYYLSSLVLTYAIAFIITVVVELPGANLEAIAWRKWEKKQVKDPALD